MTEDHVCIDACSATPRGTQSFADVGGRNNLLSFSIAESEGGGIGYSTPGPGSSTLPLSASSVSWVDEMNAELAEFDALTGGIRPGGAMTAGMEAELQSQLASPVAPPAAGAAPARGAVAQR